MWKKTVSVSTLKKWPLTDNFTIESENGKLFDAAKKLHMLTKDHSFTMLA